MSSIAVIPLSQILAEAVTENQVPQRATAPPAQNRNAAVRSPVRQVAANPLVVVFPAQVEYFDERLIFSPLALNNFRNLIKKQCLTDVNECINRYLVKEEDKITLKKRIMGSPVEMIRKVFRRFDNSSWESLLMWLVPSEGALNEFKSVLPLDEIFNEMLKDCIFCKYDPSHQANKCKLRIKFSFHPLDRFLNWYFESSAKVTEYKLRRIYSYAEIDAINTSLRKQGSRHVKAVVGWIFENNSEQLVKFKSKTKGEKIQIGIPL